MEPSGAPWRVLETAEPAATRESQASPPPRVPWIAVAIGVLALVVGAVAVAITLSSTPIVGVDGAAPYAAGSIAASDAPSASGTASADLVVDVSGAVVHPGLYRLRPGSRVGDAIRAAGGYAGSVDAVLADRELNLAAAVHDGDKVRVPVRGDAAAASSASSAGAGGRPAGGPVDLNRATADELDTLPGIGPATAAKIIAAREQQPFTTIDDLGTRKVVGQATLEKLRPLVTVGP